MLGVLGIRTSNPSNMSSTPSPKNQTGDELPVFTPHPHRVPGILPALPVKKQAPDSEDKRKNFNQRCGSSRLKVQNEVTPCNQCEFRGPCKKRENLFNYSMITRNLYKN